VVRAENTDERHIKLLPATERRRRLAIVAQELARARCCKAFPTNHAGIKRVTELRILLLDELEL